MSYSGNQTNKALQILEDRIKEEYSKAWEELDTQASSYFAKMKERFEKEKKAYLKGVYTREEWVEWQKTQYMRGEKWISLRDDMAKRISNANSIVSSYINDTTPSIYTLNANFSAYELETMTGIAFNIYDEQTIKNLMLGNNQVEFKVTKTNPKRDYEWNKKRIDSELISGILQGKHPTKIASGFMSVMKSNQSAAIRNARTAVTSAQNAGRQASYEQAVEMGIEVQKEWMATLDNRTRDSHQDMDGVRVDYNDLFPNGLEYPADPNGAPAEVYNCRCTMRAILPKYNASTSLDRAYKKDGHREFDSNDNAKTVSGVNYNQWIGKKQNATSQNQPNIPFIEKFTPAKTIKEAEEYIRKYIDDSEFGSLGVKYSGISVDVANDINKAISKVFDNFDIDKLGGVFAPAKNTKLWNLIEGAHAGYSPVRNSIVLNKENMKNKESALKSLSQDNEVIKRYIADRNAFDLSKLSKRARYVLENSVESGRAITPSNVEEAIYHELGHAIERKARKMGIIDDIISDMDKYASKISGYSTYEKGEYIAESFASYMKNENVIDPKMKKFFDGIRRKNG